MKALPYLLVALLASACGDSPLDPSPALVSLGVQVVTNGGQPVVNEPVTLMGRPSASVQPQRTDAQGIARWRVASNQRYPMLIRGELRFSEVIVVNDSQWLVSLPE